MHTQKQGVSCSHSVACVYQCVLAQLTWYWFPKQPPILLVLRVLSSADSTQLVQVIWNLKLVAKSPLTQPDCCCTSTQFQLTNHGLWSLKLYPFFSTLQKQTNQQKGKKTKDGKKRIKEEEDGLCSEISSLIKRQTQSGRIAPKGFALLLVYITKFQLLSSSNYKFS